MAMVWVAPKGKHNEKKNFHIAKNKASLDFDQYGKTIYICVNNFENEDCYFTLSGKYLNNFRSNFEKRLWKVIAIIL